MSAVAESRRSSRGRWVVAALVLAGVAAGLISVNHWQDKAAKPSAPGAGSAPMNLQVVAGELEDLEQRVKTAVDHGRADTVRRDVEKFIARYPRFGPAYRLMGLVYLALDKLDKAYEQFRLSLELDAAQGEVHLLAGSICVQQDRIDDAEHHYLEAIGLDPTNIRYRMHLAQCWVQQRRLDEARQQLMTVLRYDSSHHRAYAMLSDVYLSENKTVLAMNQIIRALEATPLTERDDQVKYLRRKAAILRRQNEPAESLQVLEHLSDLERLDPGVIAEMAVSLSMQGRFGDAALLYESALRQVPTDWRLAAGAADWWLKAGQRDKARLAVDKLRAINPRLPAVADLENRLMP